MIIRKCKTKGAFEAIPEKPMTLDLEKIKNKFKLIADLPILVIVNVMDYEVICYKSGKILIKNCDSEEEARKVINDII